MHYEHLINSLRVLTNVKHNSTPSKNITNYRTLTKNVKHE